MTTMKDFKAPNGEPAQTVEDLAWALAQEYQLSYRVQVVLEADAGLLAQAGASLDGIADALDDLMREMLNDEVSRWNEMEKVDAAVVADAERQTEAARVAAEEEREALDYLPSDDGGCVE